MNKVKLHQQNKFWIGLFLLQIVVFYVCSQWEFSIAFGRSFFDARKEVFQWFFSKIPFSIGDIGYTLLSLLLGYFLWKIIRSKNRKIYSVRLLRWLNGFYFVYQIFWGLTYFQMPITYYLDSEEPTQEEIKLLVVRYLSLAKQTRTKVKEDERGVFKISDWDSLEKEILDRQNTLPTKIHPRKGTGIPNFKESLYSSVMSYTGILGYYNPFTTEAQYNKYLPHTMLPFTLAHESAHQLGYAREQEANFIAYLLAENTQNADLKYSIEYYVLKSLLNSLMPENETFVEEILSEYSVEMKRDREAEKKFIIKNQSVMNDVFAFTNDLFLKSNQQEGSITYSYFVGLLVRYERHKQSK